MSTISRFWTPANIQDFDDDQTNQEKLNNQWNNNLNGFTEQGILGNPWNLTNFPTATNYFNPSTTDFPTPPTSAYVPINWNAFSGRMPVYFPNLSQEQQYELADTGYLNSGGTTTVTFGNIPQDPCDPVSTEVVQFGPYGPRGWQDEYCEWAVVRDPTTNKITRIDFTCENPEYWYTLWMISPDKVLQLYQQILNKPQITLEDLQLTDRDGNSVIDPSTGLPAYNPLNKWNSGPFSSSEQGGAMHLTSTPNTLQTEIGIASVNTMQRTLSSLNPNSLICCTQFGQINRNSDPHIGYVVNTTVGAGYTVTLANPVGLYIQTPNLTSLAPPAGHSDDPADFWTVLRGSNTLSDEWGNVLPGNFILHAKYEVPAEKGYCVGDMTINGQPIEWGGQIVKLITMQLVAMGFEKSAPAPISCVSELTDYFAQPAQLFHAQVFTTMSGTAVSTVNFPMCLLSNSTLIAPLVAQGASNIPMVLVCDTVTLGSNGELPDVSFTSDGITVTVISSLPVAYTIPGNDYPGNYTALNIQINVTETATLGLRGAYVTNHGQTQQAAMPALLNIVAAGSI